VKRQHKSILRGFGFVMVWIWTDVLAIEHEEANFPARRFLSALSAGEYSRARHMLDPSNTASDEFLKLWWSECTRNVEHSTDLELTSSFVKSHLERPYSYTRLTYSMNARGAVVPVFVTIERRERERAITDFSCGMTRASIERMKPLFPSDR
jgi:hypothetical protein